MKKTTSSRARYRSRRERLRQHLRAWRLGFVAVGLALAVVVAFNWRTIYDWARTFFW